MGSAARVRAGSAPMRFDLLPKNIDSVDVAEALHSWHEDLYLHGENTEKLANDTKDLVRAFMSTAYLTSTKKMELFGGQERGNWIKSQTN